MFKRLLKDFAPYPLNELNIIRRKSDSAIMCGLARCFQFKKESEIGNTAIKTYVSEKKALSAAWSSYRYTEDDVYIEKITETISSSN